MKLNPVNFLIALGLAAVLAFALWSIGGALQVYVGIGSFVFCAATLVPAIGLRYALPRRGVNLRLVSFIFLLLALAINAAFALLPWSVTAYVVVNLLLFLVYAFIANTVYTVRQ